MKDIAQIPCTGGGLFNFMIMESISEFDEGVLVHYAKTLPFSLDEVKRIYFLTNKSLDITRDALLIMQSLGVGVNEGIDSASKLKSIVSDYVIAEERVLEIYSLCGKWEDVRFYSKIINTTNANFRFIYTCLSLGLEKNVIELLSESIFPND